MTTERRHRPIDFIGDPRPLGTLLRQLREAEDPDFSVADVARQLGKPPEWYAGVEAGTILPDLRDLDAIGHLFGMILQINFRPIPVVHRPDEIPSFASEAEEADWWYTHELGDGFRSGSAPLPDALARILPAARKEQPRSRARG